MLLSIDFLDFFLFKILIIFDSFPLSIWLSSILHSSLKFSIVNTQGMWLGDRRIPWESSNDYVRGVLSRQQFLLERDIVEVEDDKTF